MVLRREGVEDGIAEFVREEGANGFEPEGTDEATEMDADGHTEAEATEGHGVAEGWAGARTAGMEEQQEEDAQEDN